MRSFFRLLICLALPLGLLSETAALRVVMHCSMGDIEAELYPDKAPLTVANFLAYLDAGMYEKCSFFRVVRPDNQPNDRVKIEVVQADGPADERCLPPIRLERTDQTGLRHCDGALSMARGAPDSAQGSFFICIHDQPELDFAGRRNPDGQGFAVFGKVIRGMDVVCAIQSMPADGQTLRKPVTIHSIRRKR